jgi:hypothetical protein
MERAPGDTTSARPPAGRDDTGLPALRADFPQFRIWRETTGRRTRYIARSLHRGTRPHTVVTADLGELRAELSSGCGASRPATDRAREDARPHDSHQPGAHQEKQKETTR